MDIVESCQRKLVHFRLKELKDVLASAGLSKQGKKQDLMDRILALLYEEGTPGILRKNLNGKQAVMEIIDNAYRKNQQNGAGDSSTKKHSGSSGSKMQLKGESADSLRCDRKVRCPCRNTSTTEPLIQCVDSDCGVWQHVPCVVIPEKPLVDNQLRSQFFCEICRVKRADPFWINIGCTLDPAKLAVTIDGSNPVQRLEKTFQLTRVDTDLLLQAEYDIQAWCILLNDNVRFRIQWLHYTDLQVNGITVRTTNRPGTQPLGVNGRDDGARIKSCLCEGVNKISLAGCDDRAFCFGVRLVKRRTVQQVLSMIPREPDGESFQDALSRVRRCVGGGMTKGNEDSDSDLEVITDSITFNLRCPMSGSRIKTAGRFKPCVHLGCFDLETFIGLNERSRKWQCHICLKNYSLEDIIIDPYFSRIVTQMHKCKEEITEIDLKPDGSWRVKNANEFRDLVQWHNPDGSTEGNLLENYDNSSKGLSSHMVGMNVSEHRNACQFYEEAQTENFEQKIITISSTSSGDDRDDDGVTVNQIVDEQMFDINRSDFDFGAPCYGISHEAVVQSSNAPGVNADIIIISDSEEDEVGLVCSVALPGSDPKPSSLPPSSCTVDGSVRQYYIADSEEISLSMPPLLRSSANATGSGFPFLVVDSNEADSVIDLEHTSITCSGPISSTLSSELTANPVSQILDSSVCPYNVAADNGFVDYRSTSASTPPDSGIPLPSVSCSHGDDWVSLGLGNSGYGGCSNSKKAQAESANGIGRNMGSRLNLKEALSVKTMKADSTLVSKKRSDGPFSFTRLPRSIRRRPGQRLFQC